MTTKGFEHVTNRWQPALPREKMSSWPQLKYKSWKEPASTSTMYKTDKDLSEHHRHTCIHYFVMFVPWWPHNMCRFVFSSQDLYVLLWFLLLLSIWTLDYSYQGWYTIIYLVTCLSTSHLKATIIAFTFTLIFEVVGLQCKFQPAKIFPEISTSDFSPWYVQVQVYGIISVNIFI